MRSQFKGHFGEPQEAIDELWKEATFVFDANVLLNLYRYSDKARKEFLNLMAGIQERSWLPEQCVHEFLSNRLSVIREQMMSYSDTAKSIKAIQGTFAGSKGHPFVSEKNFSELDAVLGKIDKELTKNRKAQETRLTEDTIKEQIADIFDGRVGSGFSDEDLDKIFSEGEVRYSEEIPPGYKDGNKHPNPTRRSEKRSNFGDFLLWRQTMDWAKAESKDVVLVTDDQKEDWWLIVSGKTVSARPELTTEFCEETGRRILFYNPDRFLQLAQEKLGLKVSERTITEIREEHDSRSLARAEAQKRNLRREDILRRKLMHEREMDRANSKLKARSIFDSEGGELAARDLKLSNRYKVRRRSLLEDDYALIRARRRELDTMMHEAKHAGVELDPRDIAEEREALRRQERVLSAKLRDLDDLDI